MLRLVLVLGLGAGCWAWCVESELTISCIISFSRLASLASSRNVASRAACSRWISPPSFSLAAVLCCSCLSASSLRAARPRASTASATLARSSPSALSHLASASST